YRLVSHSDGLWLEGFKDKEEEWEIVDGPFATRYESACALRRCRERQEHRESRAPAVGFSAFFWVFSFVCGRFSSIFLHWSDQSGELRPLPAGLWRGLRLQGAGRAIAPSSRALQVLPPCTPPSRCAPPRQLSATARTLPRRAHAVLQFCLAILNSLDKRRGGSQSRPAVTEDARFVGKGLENPTASL